MTDSELEHKARRLRELFKGRFDQTVAEKLITELGGEEQAVDFLMNEKEEQVRGFLKESPEYLQSLRADSQYTASLLTNGLQECVRQFACKDCDRAWWKRVPSRKEVSKCRRCKVKYDPIPKDKEWGWGSFICTCGHEFSGFAIMGLTTSKCYKCPAEVPVDHIMPPRRKKRPRKTNAPHVCNGVNCYGYQPPNNMNDINYGAGAMTLSDYDSNQHMGGPRRHRSDHQHHDHSNDTDSGQPGAYPGPAPQPMCIHPKSVKKGRSKPRTFSTRHVSSGSTVTTFMIQGSIDSQTISIAKTMDTISEY